MLNSLVTMVAAGALAGTSMASPMRASEAHLAPLHTPPAPPADRPIIGVQGMRGPESHLVPDSYIVVFKKGTPDHHVHAHKEQVQALWTEENGRMQKRGIDWGRMFGGLKHHYKIGASGFQGYTAHIPASILSHIRALPEVAYVERDSIVTINDPYFSTATTVPTIPGDSIAPSEIDTEYGAPWGLARISHRNRLGFGSFNVYPYEHDGGAGVDVYVIDTGVNIDHVELQGRAKWGKTIPNDVDEDSNGHGSHCAGTIASRAYGVAKNASIIAVKVLGAGGSGTMGDVIAGVDWATTNAEEKAAAESLRSDSTHKGSVASMSLGGGKSQGLDDAVDAAVDTGLHFAVAAGNDAKSACTFSPAAAKNPLTVGASTIQDEIAYFSNHGECVDIFAPGLNIKSIWNTGNTSINTISGTSMACPHVAGGLAYFLSLYPDRLDVAAILGEEASEARMDIAWSTAGLRQGGQLVFDRLRQAAGYGTKFAPIPKKGLSPKQLKALMIKLATKDALTGLPARTVNALMFNNVTQS